MRYEKYKNKIRFYKVILIINNINIIYKVFILIIYKSYFTILLIVNHIYMNLKQNKYPTLNALNGNNYSFDTNCIIFMY